MDQGASGGSSGSRVRIKRCLRSSKTESGTKSWKGCKSLFNMFNFEECVNVIFYVHQDGRRVIDVCKKFY